MPKFKVCVNCGTEKPADRPGAFWHLSSYYGIGGTFCSDCMQLVDHDSYGNPKNPDAHKIIRVKQMLERANLSASERR